MFDPILRALKGSQLLFVSAVFSLSFSVYATDSGPVLDNEIKVIEQSIDLDAKTNTKMITDAVVITQTEDEAENLIQGAGPELVVLPESPEVGGAIDELSSGVKSITQKQLLGPLLYSPNVSEFQKQILLPRFPVSNFTTGNEEESLDLLWKKTFPVHKKPKQNNVIVNSNTTTRDIPVLVDTRPTITIIIDDLGYNRRGMEESLSLPVEVALAILPHTPFSKKTAHAATEQSRTIMLHVPMENERELKLGPGGLYRNMDEAELKKTLKEGIASVPGISGINNHMGSLLTQDVERMKWVMEVIQPMELFFVDSLTSPNSVALAKALKFDLTTTKRDVFLDNVQEEKAIDKQFQRLLAIARKRGKALAIGHPYPSTMSYLSNRLTELESEGIKLVSITDYIE